MHERPAKKNLYAVCVYVWGRRQWSCLTLNSVLGIQYWLCYKNSVNIFGNFKLHEHMITITISKANLKCLLFLPAFIKFETTVPRKIMRTELY